MHLPLTAGMWRPGAADPTLTGWLITAGYLLTAVRSILAARAAKTLRTEATARPWWWIAGFALLLGINKQMDLQALLIEWGRDFSQMLGVSAHNRVIQKAFLLFLGLAGLPVFIWWIRHYRSFLRNHRRLFAGILIVLLYAGLRAADTLHVTGAASSDDSGWSCLFEISGVSLMLLGAGIRRKAPSTVTPA